MDEALIEALVDLSEQAGAAIMEVYDRDDLGVREKDDASPVTEADEAADKLISAGLRAEFPDLPLVTEEQAATIQELLTIIRRMVEDNDLTIHEFAELDRWLAARQEIQDVYPASLIFEGIHAICADDIVDQQELDAMCGVLKKIARELP